MRRVIFIENGYSTDIYLDVAKELVERDIEVILFCWNDWFARKWNDFKVIHLPSSKEFLWYEFIKSTRESRYFKLPHEKYQIDHNLVQEIILNLNPSVIVGEPTLAYEQQIALIAKNVDIPYVYISVSRLFPGRIVLYNNVLMNALDIDTTSLKLSTGQEVIIKNKSRINFIIMYAYNHLGQLFTRSRRIAPSIMMKIYLELNARYYYRKLNLLRRVNLREIGSYVLFPIQMQPESNTDVWAMPYFNQVELLRKFSKIPGVNVLIKLNPTSKYEIDGEFLKLVEESGNLNVCPRDIPMKEALEKCKAVFSNVGTVILEARRFGVHVISLNLDNDLVNLPGVVKVNDIQEITSTFLHNLPIEKRCIGLGNVLENEKNKSVPGIIFDPLRSYVVNRKLNSINISKLLQAFLQ
jgi:hypothetical protein